MTEHPAMIYHLARADDWARAKRRGVYAGGAACRAHGFIHFSRGCQLPATLTRFFPCAADLVVLAAETAALGAALRRGPAEGGGPFPHVYARLDTDRLACLGPVTPSQAGARVLPEGVRA